jgi:glycosyltransferase involved in cell wall biosynthesis
MGMSQPRVTVGMPVHNDPDGLRRSVPNIFGQTWRGRLRLLIVDDGSTDQTAEVAASLREHYDGIEIIRMPQNMGRPVARNRIVQLAGDDYLAWCDSGDLWHPRKLELQLASLIEAEQRDPSTRLLCTGSIHWVQADSGATRIRVPDTDGDQLRNALLGSLFPYLQGLIGRANHFRDLGGFDERLLRRQDYDFLVRFLSTGGRMVAAPRDVPVFTYIKAYPSDSAEVVARVNRVIRAKHRPYYRRYHPRLARQVRSNQYRLVARFHDHGEPTARGRAYRMLAWLWAPDFDTPTRGLKRLLHPRRHAAVATGLVISGARPLVSALRRSRIGGVARKAGLGRVVARLGVPQLHSSPAGHPAKISADSTRALREDMRLEPAGWLELERDHRERGLLHSAESALRKGLEQHPDDGELLASLIEILPMRRKWSECIGLWSAQGSMAAARALTYARVARAYRHLSRPAEALAVADAGARRWPDHPTLRNELHLSRAELIDWKQAIVDVPGTSSPDSDAAVGVVTSLGDLGGEVGPVHGEVTALGNTAPGVAVLVNGAPVAATSAALDAARGRTVFSLNCRELRHFIGDGDVISVECDRRALIIAGGGTARTIKTGYKSRFSDLQQRLNAGFVFTKFGTLRPGNTAETKSQTMSLYNEIAAILEESRGYSAYPFYGNLLGAIREHDIIAHDAGGFDMGYVSRHRDPREVRTEFLDVCRSLLGRGYHLRVEPWSVYVRPTHSSPVFVDVNYAWFTQSGDLQFSFGWRHAPVTDRDHFFYPRESLIGRHPVRVPGNAEAVLEQIYGPTWAIPDQGFALDRDLTRSSEFLLTEAEMRDLEHIDPDRVEARLDHFRENGDSPGPEQLADE